jgi:CARDB protein
MSKKILQKLAALSVVSLFVAAGCAGADGEAASAADGEGANAAADESVNAADGPTDEASAAFSFPFPIAKPNLVPVQVNPGFGFCTGSNGNLLVRIKNTGSVTAPASNTMVNFGSVRDHRGATPSLAPGATFDLLFPIPSGCFKPDCGFSIVADETFKVNESSESDNTAFGACVG